VTEYWLEMFHGGKPSLLSVFSSSNVVKIDLYLYSEGKCVHKFKVMLTRTA
jgi:hypothetical protein